jgi:hypothetical protein
MEPRLLVCFSTLTDIQGSTWAEAVVLLLERPLLGEYKLGFRMEIVFAPWEAPSRITVALLGRKRREQLTISKGEEMPQVEQ